MRRPKYESNHRNKHHSPFIPHSLSHVNELLLNIQLFWSFVRSIEKWIGGHAVRRSSDPALCEWWMQGRRSHFSLPISLFHFFRNFFFCIFCDWEMHTNGSRAPGGNNTCVFQLFYYSLLNSYIGSGFWAFGSGTCNAKMLKRIVRNLFMDSIDWWRGGGSCQCFGRFLQFDLSETCTQPQLARTLYTSSIHSINKSNWIVLRPHMCGLFLVKQTARRAMNEWRDGKAR